MRGRALVLLLSPLPPRLLNELNNIRALNSPTLPRATSSGSVQYGDRCPPYLACIPPFATCYLKDNLGILILAYMAAAGSGISNFSATPSAQLGGEDPNSPNKRPCGGGETLTLQTLRGELSRERAEFRKEINNALAGATTRFTNLEQGLEQQGARTLQAVETITTTQAEQGLRHQRIQDDIGARMSTLEHEMKTFSLREQPFHC